jgi:Domain of unknown function (DUF1707)/Cell wall-active antibiotics response 4TMS YvqF
MRGFIVTGVSDPDEQQLRASDAERQAIADHLNTAVGEGRLTLEEFSDRVGAAYAARTHGELERLTTDLPAPTGRPAIVVDAHPITATPAEAPLDIKVGAIKKLGRWRLKKDNAMGVAIGPIKLDLRGADLAAREITLSARTVVGAIKVWVPRGVRVEVEGKTAVGTRTVAESNLPPDMDVPTLRLRLDTVLGTVKVYRTGDHQHASFGWHQA